MNRTYEDRKEYMRKYQREWVASRRRKYLEDKECVRCGSGEDLQLDHVDPADKVAHAIWSWSEPRRLLELAKCQVLCLSCHKSKTYGSDLPGMWGYEVGAHGVTRYRAGCRCVVCRAAVTAARRRQRRRLESGLVVFGYSHRLNGIISLRCKWVHEAFGSPGLGVRLSPS